jgi:O-antigen/teichoic acid export membrane protein
MLNWKPIPWHTIKKSTLARNTVSMFTGGAITMALQAAYFVMIARSLGPAQYGAFVGVAALIAALSPFAALGIGAVLVKNVSRDRGSFRESLGNAILIASGLGLSLLILVCSASPFILSAKVPLALVLLVGVSDLILGGLVSLAGLAFQAFEMLGKTAQLTAIQSGLRAVGALVMLVSFSNPSAVSWAVLYLGTSSLAAAYALMVVFRRWGYPRFALSRLRSEIVEGFSFSIGASSAALYNNIDKTLLVRLGTLSAAGFYAIAYRVLDLAFQPVGALQASAFSKFFQHGSGGITHSVRYARRLLSIGAGYGIFAGGAIFFGAPLFPYIFGRQFAGSVEVLRWLSPLVFFRAAHYCYSNAMTGADFQGLRSSIQVGVAVLNVALNLWLIPSYSWRGAAWASLVSDGLLVLITWAATLILSARLMPHQRARALQSESTT